MVLPYDFAIYCDVHFAGATLDKRIIAIERDREAPEKSVIVFCANIPAGSFTTKVI